MSALGVNLPGLIAQIINFSILLFVLYVLLYKPVLKALDNRSKKIKESMDLAEKLKQDSARMEEEVKKRLDEARKEGQTLIAQASHIGERLKEEARTQAKAEADAIVARAKAEIQRERDEALEELRRQFADLAVLAAQRVINASLDKQAHKKLIDEVLQSSTALRKN